MVNIFIRINNSYVIRKKLYFVREIPPFCIDIKYNLYSCYKAEREREREKEREREREREREGERERERDEQKWMDKYESFFVVMNFLIVFN